MDYLHGDVADDELEGACYYEYARESNLLREAAIHYKTEKEAFSRARSNEAKRRKKIGWPAPLGGTKDEVLPDGGITYLKVEEKFGCGPWFMQAPWSSIWACPSFPDRSWNQLNDAEREDIKRCFGAPATAIRPLQMLNVALLEAMGVWDDFKALAKHGRSERINPILDGAGHSRLTKLQARLRRLGMLRAETQNRTDIRHITNQLEAQIQKQSEQWRRQTYALFAIDFGKSETRLLEEFKAWLRLPEIKKRFEIHKPNRSVVGSTGSFTDRLKDLAASRVFEAFKEDTKKADWFTHENRKTFQADTTIMRPLPKKTGEKKRTVQKIHFRRGDPRPFHDARGGQSNEPLNQVSLYSESGDWRKAQREALRFRQELIPWELTPVAPTKKKVSKRRP
jgi:hypothetical protein